MWSFLPGILALMVFFAAIMAIIGVALFYIGYGIYRLFRLSAGKKPRARP